MSISRSGYYKWKYRKENHSLREITRQSDLELIIQIIMFIDYVSMKI